MASLPPNIEVKSRDYEDFDPLLLDRIRASLTLRVNSIKASKKMESVYVYVDDTPLTFFQMINLSGTLTAENDIPILVLPRKLNNSASPIQGTKNVPYTNHYCQFEAQITGVYEENDKLSSFDFVQVFNKLGKEGEHERYLLRFSGDKPPTRSFYCPELSFSFRRHIYRAQASSMNIMVASETPLELGNSYLLNGIIWTAMDKNNKKSIPFQEHNMLVDWAKNTREMLELDSSFFAKFKGLSLDRMIDACAHPAENSVSDYKQLIFHSVFYIKRRFPLNIMLIGVPGCTKTFFLKRLSAITRDNFYDAASCRVKGFMPSFASKGTDPGAFAKSKFAVIINEFFELSRQQDNKSDYGLYSQMKNLLEGEPVIAASGHGSIRVIMRGAVFGATNWPTLPGGSHMDTVKEMYQRFEPAFLDRFLLYPVPTKAQMSLVAAHKIRVDEMLEETLPGEEDIVKKLQTFGRHGLTPLDLYTLIHFKEGITTRLTKEAQEFLIHSSNDIIEQYGAEYYSRSQEIIVNLASSYAFARELRGGYVDKDTKQIIIMNNDVRDALVFYKVILARHRGRSESAGMTRKEYNENGATAQEALILKKLQMVWEEDKTENKAASAVPIEEVQDYFFHHSPQGNWPLAVRHLIENRTILCDGERLLWYPCNLADEAEQALNLGGAGLIGYETVLMRMGLLRLEKEGKGGGVTAYVNPWIPCPPTQVGVSVQNVIRMQIKKTEKLFGYATTKQMQGYAENLENVMQSLWFDGLIKKEKDGWVMR